MKKKLILVAAVCLSAIVVSCQKDPQGGTTRNMQEQIDYMDTVGEEALSQIEPEDFQKLSDIVNDLSNIGDSLEFDSFSQTKLAVLVGNLLEYEGGNVYLLINTDKINGTVTISGNTAVYSAGAGKRIIYKAENNTYTAVITITPGSKEVRLGTYQMSIGTQTSDIDIKLLVPTAVTVEIYYNSELYMGVDMNIDGSAMPQDWSSLSFSQINLSASGTGFINGKGSYRADISKFSIADKNVQCEGNVYGSNGAFLAGGTVALALQESVQGEVYMERASFSGNIVDKLDVKLNSFEGVDFYLDKSSTDKVSVNGTSGDVTFADGTVKSTSEVFTAENFPKTYSCGIMKVYEFMMIFGYIDFLDMKNQSK